MNPTDKYYKIYLLFFLIYLSLSVGTPITFSDGTEYIALMGKSIFTSDYWNVLHQMFRGWFVPFVYSFFGKPNFINGMVIVIFQTSFLFFSWVIFIRCIFSYLDSEIKSHFLLFVILLSLIFSLGYLCLNKYTLSDSISMSVVLLYISYLFSAEKLIDVIKNNKVLIVVYIASIILLTSILLGSRDSNISIVILGSLFFIYFIGRRIPLWLSYFL